MAASRTVSSNIPGYNYRAQTIARSKVSIEDLAALKESVQFMEEDEKFLRLAGEVMSDQTKQIVEHWRSTIIASIPNLARHSRTPEGNPLPEYLAKSNLRFQQWILDTCFRSYDQDWLDYQEEIALRHTSLKKNRIDSVESTDHVPYRDIVAFVAVMNETIRPYLAAKGHSDEQVMRMHLAWQKSLQMQIALWAKPYMDAANSTNEW
ncbi:MAG TPA: protoglobin domain-containing protein [Coleofasciculaceae cyanobacterium]